MDKSTLTIHSGGGSSYSAPTLVHFDLQTEQGFALSGEIGYDQDGIEDTLVDGYEEL